MRTSMARSGRWAATPSRREVRVPSHLVGDPDDPGSAPLRGSGPACHGPEPRVVASDEGRQAQQGEHQIRHRKCHAVDDHPTLPFHPSGQHKSKSRGTFRAASSRPSPTRLTSILKPRSATGHVARRLLRAPSFRTCKSRNGPCLQVRAAWPSPNPSRIGSRRVGYRPVFVCSLKRIGLTFGL
jgi:hypothetical protein